MEKENDTQTSPIFEKPLECCDCQNEIEVHYTEMCMKSSSHIGMCRACPGLKTLLEDDNSSQKTQNSSEVCCGNCYTTYASVARGGPMGCALCYDLLENLLQSEILTQSQSLYQGRKPKEKTIHSPSARLYSLNKALNETLSKEEYERAAQIRDQINLLIKKNQYLPPENT